MLPRTDEHFCWSSQSLGSPLQATTGPGWWTMVTRRVRQLSFICYSLLGPRWAKVSAQFRFSSVCGFLVWTCRVVQHKDLEMVLMKVLKLAALPRVFYGLTVSASTYLGALREQ